MDWKILGVFKPPYGILTMRMAIVLVETAYICHL